jgi:hypothetical protein
MEKITEEEHPESPASPAIAPLLPIPFPTEITERMPRRISSSVPSAMDPISGEESQESAVINVITVHMDLAILTGGKRIMPLTPDRTTPAVIPTSAMEKITEEDM